MANSWILDAQTRLCGVFGHPIAHSASPAMHNAAFEALGLNWRYAAFDVDPEALEEALRGAAAMHFAGINLTVPHKLLALPLMDQLDASASTWGAVNTVRFEVHQHGAWVPMRQAREPISSEVRMVGFNTDADAISRAIGEDLGLALKGAAVLLLGTGGAGRVAALKAAQEGSAHLWLLNRTEEKARDLAREIAERHPGVAVEVGYPDRAVDLVIQATSLGLRREDPLPLDPGQFDLRRAGAVFDMVYRPAETPLLQAARAAGVKTANGLGMLLHQGAAAFAIWTGLPAPVEVMRRALLQNIHG